MRYSGKIRLFFLLPTALIVVACASISMNLPPVTESPTGEHSPGKVIWHDLLTNDPEASQQFYGELFGWEFDGAGNGYTLIRHNGKLIGGMIDTVALNGRDDISQWVVVMSVADIDDAASAVSAGGGTIMTPPTDLRDRGRLAVVRDAEGALLALLETRDGDPPDTDAGMGDFLWDELWTSDVDNASRFYNGVAGLQVAQPNIDEVRESAPNYRLFNGGGKPRVGVMPTPLEGLDPVWVSYLWVVDPAAITARVAGLGGRVIVEAQARPLGGRVAFVAGPSGAGIALQTWPLDRNPAGDSP